MAKRAWEVLLNEKQIDIVWFDADLNRDTVLRSLIDHDGYNYRINIRLYWNRR
jgi:hypothetical protein